MSDLLDMSYDKLYPNMRSLASPNKFHNVSYKYSLMEILDRRYYDDLYNASLNETKSLRLASFVLSRFDDIQYLKDY